MGCTQIQQKYPSLHRTFYCFPYHSICTLLTMAFSYNKNYFLKASYRFMRRKSWQSKLHDDKSDWDRSRLFPGLPMNHIICFRWFPRKIILGITSSMCVSLCSLLLTLEFIYWFQLNLTKRGDLKTTRLHKFSKTRKPGRKRESIKFRLLKKHRSRVQTSLDPQVNQEDMILLEITCH